MTGAEMTGADKTSPIPVEKGAADAAAPVSLTDVVLAGDIGGTNTKYGIVNHRGEILQQGELKTEDYPEINSFVDALFQTLSPIIASLNKKNFRLFFLSYKKIKCFTPESEIFRIEEIYFF